MRNRVSRTFGGPSSSGTDELRASRTGHETGSEFPPRALTPPNRGDGWRRGGGTVRRCVHGVHLEADRSGRAAPSERAAGRRRLFGRPRAGSRLRCPRDERSRSASSHTWARRTLGRPTQRSRSSPRRVRASMPARCGCSRRKHSGVWVNESGRRTSGSSRGRSASTSAPLSSAPRWRWRRSRGASSFSTRSSGPTTPNAAPRGRGSFSQASTARSCSLVRSMHSRSSSVRFPRSSSRCSSASCRSSSSASARSAR